MHTIISDGYINTVQIEDILTPERVLLMSCTSKSEAIDNLIDCLADTPEVTDPVELKREMYARERLMSTGLGVGFGVPHVRLASVTNLVMAVGVNDRDLEDYTTLDDSFVRVLCMIAARDDQHVRYLQALSALRPLMKDVGQCDLLLQAPDALVAYKILCNSTKLQ